MQGQHWNASAANTGATLITAIFGLQAQEQIVQLQHELECCSVKVGQILCHLGRSARKADQSFDCHVYGGTMQRVTSDSKAAAGSDFCVAIEWMLKMRDMIHRVVILQL